MSQPYRYAIYFCPRTDSQLGRFGADWLAMDEFHSVTQTPRRYGFHGTLKPPFRLAARATHDQLVDAVCVLASSIKPFIVDGFDIKTIGNFIALVPRSVPSQLPDLANRCVRAIDTFRAPPDRDELTRRRRSNLTPAQDQLLMQWGYPYVMDEFRFHLTLTEEIDASARELILPKITHLAAKALGPYQFDDICLVMEPTLGAQFELLSRYPLGGSNRIHESGSTVGQ